MKEEFFKVSAPKVSIDISDIDNFNNSEQAQQAVKKANNQYLHWEELRLKDWIPANKESFWSYIKFIRRFSDSKIMPVKDKSGNFFRINTKYYAEFIHIIDKEMAGNFIGIPAINDADKKQFITRNIIEESIASSKLEGANTSRAVAKKMLLEGRLPRNYGEKMIFNSHKTMQAIEERYCKEKLSLELLYELHTMITKDTIALESQGKIRETFDSKGSRLVIKPWDDKIVAYETPDKEFVEAELHKLIDFANDKGDEEFIHPLIKAIILHFWIGLLHPFEDGNGRLARVLFYWYMLKNGYWAFAYLSLSEKILKSPKQYAMAYIYSEQDDYDLNYFVNYNIAKLQLARDDFQKYIKQKLDENKQLLSQTRLNYDFNERQIKLLQYLKNNLESYTTLSTHQNLYGIGKVTANTDLGKLYKLGFLTKKRQGQKIHYYPTKMVAEIFK